MSVKRYEPHYAEGKRNDGHATMAETASGDYVRFEDYEQAVALRDAKIARLQDLLDQLSAASVKLATAVLKPVDPPSQSVQAEKPNES